jgi:hypothetical protein
MTHVHVRRRTRCDEHATRANALPATILAWALALPCLALGPTDAYARQQQQPPPPVCQTNSEFRQFDFWIGEWTVTNSANGQVAGENRIESRESGCVLVEHWTASGSTGMSMNYYDSITGKWRQIWVASNYSIDMAGGLNADGAMVLEGQLHNYRQGQALDFRGTWTPNPDGSVRQLFEQKDPQTGEWNVWFDGRYVRKQ